ncbi:MAG: DUF4239 domain-containing protein [Chloroflexi bacterium]|nr:DUF4239 domain-containing protein [Chloroflexota bacterium]
MSRSFWLRLGVVLPGALALHAVLHQSTDLLSDVGGVGAFVTAVGTLYSVLAAFTVVSVWSEFTDTDRAIKREARELRELYRYVGYVSDQAGAKRARAAIVRYRDEVVTTEWAAMIRGETASAADDEFLAMADAVNALDVSTARDVPAWAEAVRTLGAVSDARGERVLLVTLRMPRMLKVLLYLATLSLVGGMLMLGFEHLVVGMVVVGFTAAVSLLVLEVIDDIDDPIGGAWGISVEPFVRIQFREPSVATAVPSEPRQS